VPLAKTLQGAAARQRADLEAVAVTARELSLEVARSVEERRSATRAHLGGVEPIPAPVLELLRTVLGESQEPAPVQKRTDS
jgi:hypothetical protein